MNEASDAGRRDEAGAETVRCFIEHCVSKTFGVPGSDIQRPTRGRARAAFARQTAMYLAHVALGLTYTDVGGIFRRDRTTVAHACALVEDRRDDPGFDRVMDLLEGAVRPFAQPASTDGRRSW